MHGSNSRNTPGWQKRGRDGQKELDRLLRRYLVHYRVFSEDQLPELAIKELEFRRAAILQRCRPDVFAKVFPDWKGLIDDRPEQFSVR